MTFFNLKLFNYLQISNNEYTRKFRVYLKNFYFLLYKKDFSIP